MARTLEEVKGALSRIQMAFADPNVKIIVDELNALAKDKLTQDLLAKGEEAVRALGFQQGIGIINILPELLESTIKAKEMQMSAEARSKLKL